MQQLLLTAEGDVHKRCTLLDQSKLCMMQTLLPDNPLHNPKSESYYSREVGSWVLDEAVAAYTGTDSSLQAALETYKRNFFLAVRNLTPATALAGNAGCSVLIEWQKCTSKGRSKIACCVGNMPAPGLVAAVDSFLTAWIKS